MIFETKVTQIIERTHDTKSFRFTKPEALNYKPGQFFFVTLKHEGKELKHHFSFSSSPTEKDHFEFTKKLSDSEYSTTLRALKEGDWAAIDAPYGQFTFEGEYERAAMLAGGIGVTPFISISKYCTDLKLPCKITLVYGNRTENDIAFRKELDQMQTENLNLKVVHTLNEPPKDWSGKSGFITADMLKETLPEYNNTMFYICGPPPMVQAMQNTLSKIGIPATQQKVEYFVGYE
jgi:glycine betaine catabolism B